VSLQIWRSFFFFLLLLQFHFFACSSQIFVVVVVAAAAACRHHAVRTFGIMDSEGTGFIERDLSQRAVSPFSHPFFSSPILI
jgi:hypothetical protein